MGVSGAYRTTCWVTREVGYRVTFSRAARSAEGNVYSFEVKRGESVMVKTGLSAG